MLVDDHAVVRMGFKLLLQASSDIEVVAEADSGEAACQMYESVAPDVVVMDIAMAGIGGIEAIKRLIAKDARVRILVLSAHEDTSHPKRALQAGALGYLSKRSAPEVLIDAVRTIAKGQRYLDAHIAQRIASLFKTSLATRRQLINYQPANLRFSYNSRGVSQWRKSRPRWHCLHRR